MVNRQEVPDSKVLALDVERLITCVCEEYRISKGELWCSNEVLRTFQEILLSTSSADSAVKRLPSLGKEFGTTNYSTVSSLVQRVKVRYERDKYLLKEIEIIKEKTAKGQNRT